MFALGSLAGGGGGGGGGEESFCKTTPTCMWYYHCVQGPRAEAMMKQAMDRGHWVFFQNCHLAPSWMPSLERLVEQIDGDKVCSPRLCFSPSHHIPSPTHPTTSHAHCCPVH